MHKTLKVCMRIVLFLTLASLSRIKYTGRVNKLTKVSRSEVVTKILASLSFKTLLMMSIAVFSWVEESQWPSLPTPAFGFAPLRPLPTPLVDAGFSAALASTADIVHCSRKPNSSSSCLWCWTVSCSSASRSAWTTSASAERPEVTRSRILLRAVGGRKDACLELSIRCSLRTACCGDAL